MILSLETGSGSNFLIILSEASAIKPSKIKIIFSNYSNDFKTIKFSVKSMKKEIIEVTLVF